MRLLGWARRGGDIVASALGLLVLLPVMLVLAALVRWDSPGPVIFSQQRLGLRGRPFLLFKFRTMRTGDGPHVTAAGDARVTRIGRWLRATKLDELPQLVNVLRADMSLVGPRPEVVRYAQYWTPAQRDVILSVRPGITDPITLSLRKEEELLAGADEPEAYYVQSLLPAKAARYVDYVMHRSLRSDTAVLLRTVRAVMWMGKSQPGEAS